MDKNLLEVSRFDAADYLETETEIQDYFDEVKSENTPPDLLQAINTIARAKSRIKSA